MTLEFPDVPEGVHIVWTPVSDRVDDLLGVEVDYAAAMVSRRRRAFAAGRRAAREALALLGVVPAPIARTEARAPRWPREVLGAITHTDELAGAAVAHRGQLVGLGLDVEVIARLGDDVAERICCDTEWQRLSRESASVRQRHAALIFAAKECVHKAWSPIGQVTLPFDAVEIRLHDAGRFEVLPRDARLSAWPIECWRGAWDISGGTAGTLLMLQRPA